MISAAVLRSQPGPLARTRDELIHIERRAAFRRARLTRERMWLNEADSLLDLVEECRLRGISPMPVALWSGVVRLVGTVEPGLRDELGINRDADHVSDVLFAAQEILQERARRNRQPQMAQIIQLFPGTAG
ncbi:MAG: hypothetical protein ABSA40_06445 [Candidatus Dormibacteria bacterium]|jgi:hypothetical protein